MNTEREVVVLSGARTAIGDYGGALKDVPPSELAATLTRTELLDLPARKVLHRLYHQEDIRLFEPRPVSFRCSCSGERVAAMLRMLGAAEVRSILDERDDVEVTCEFCNRAYRYDSVDAEQLFAAVPPAQGGATRH